MPMMDLGAVPMPLVVLSAVPAWEMENIPDGTDPTSSESCRRILLPEWAEEKLNELTGQNVDHSMEGMKME